jgi:NADH dehydrogenase (ubiquinone) flavoprotein 2
MKLLASSRSVNQFSFVARTPSTISASSRFFSNYHPIASHRDTPDNKITTYFDFTPENYERVSLILSRYPQNYKQAGIIPLLDLAQRQCGGWLPIAAMDKVARLVEVAPIRVYEVATFYTMFNREKVGKYFIQLCGTTPCMICGSEEIKKTIEDYLGMKEGETTADGLFTLREVECLGSCANAPMIQINDDFYECLTPETTIHLLKSAKEGKLPKVGKWGSLPMNGQVSCEGPIGKTSLTSPPPKPGQFFRTDDLTPKVGFFTHIYYMRARLSHHHDCFRTVGESSRCESAYELLTRNQKTFTFKILMVI